MVELVIGLSFLSVMLIVLVFIQHHGFKLLQSLYSNANATIEMLKIDRHLCEYYIGHQVIARSNEFVDPIRLTRIVRIEYCGIDKKSPIVITKEDGSKDENHDMRILVPYNDMMWGLVAPMPHSSQYDFLKDYNINRRLYK